MSDPDLSESDNPLLNDYKLRYVLKLLLQTFLGGVRVLFELKVPLYIYYVQFFIWILPFLIGLLFTVLVEVAKNEEELMALVYGTVMLVFHIVLQMFGFVLKQRLVSQPTTTQNFLADEDEVTFVSFLSHGTFEFLIPKKKLIVNYIFHPLLCGVLCSFSFLFLLPKRTDSLFSSTAGSWVYLVFGWLVVCIACYPLIGQFGKDPAAYRVIDSWELFPISKSCYVLGFAVLSYVGRSSISASTFTSLDLTIHIIFLLFPFFWLVGLLPPLDALLSWCSEQILIHILGGSMMATDGRLFTMLVLSATSVAIIFFIPIKLVAVVALATSSFLISLDVCTVTVNCCNRLMNFGLHRIKNDKKSVAKSSYRNTIWFFLYLFVMLALANVITVLTELYSADSQQTSYNFNVLAGVLFFVTFLNKVLCSVQHVFIVFSILRNPFYTKVCDKYTRMWFIKKSSSTVRLIVLPLCLLLVVSMVLLTPNATRSVFSSILVFRVYRMIWQDTLRCCYDILFYSILIWANFNPSSYWTSLDPSVHIFIVSLFLYFVTSFFKNIWFMFLLAHNSPTKSVKQRKKVKSAIMVTLCLAPITIAIVVLATITSSPLLPLFTLPLYIVGFPRPLRVWPQASSSTKSSSKDWVYYKQLSPALASEIKRQFRSGGLNSLNAGDYFLARFQDRIVWVSVLESGFTHCNFVIKGLELQETSCHTIEAEYVDNIFSRSFDTNVNTKNEYFTSVLTPKFSFNIDTYSDARNVLTGIIDHPDTLKSVSNFFPKVLLWVLTRYCLHRRKMGLKDTKCSHSQQIELGDCFTPENEDSALTTRTKESRLDDMIIPKMPFVKHNDKDVVVCETNFDDSPISSNKELILTPMVNLVEPIKTDVKPPFFIKPIKIGNRPDNESDDEFGDFGFSDEDIPSGTDQSLEEDENESSYEDAELKIPTLANLGSNTTDYHAVSDASKVIDPPCYWKQKLPFTERELSTYSSLISRDWYECVINSLHLADGKLIVEDSVLYKCYKHLVVTCFYIIDVAGVRDNSSLKEGPGHVLKMFYGMMPWSPHSSWLEEDEELKELVVQAYRYAFKLALDNHVFGEISDNDEMLNMLSEYEEEWFIGEEDSDKWMNNVLEGKPYLLNIFQDRGKSTIYSSRLLSKQHLEVPIAQVNTECVRGFWSALCLELYYMTNDDDERYSIQALPSLIRNIITQAADPPLGYPVYSSGLISVHL